MRRLFLLLPLLLAAFAVRPMPGTSAAAQPKPLRIIAFGAHPDDAELKASGVAALWAAQGHKVKFVAMTNGDVGHFAEAGGPLARRRKAEVAECARILGIENEVLDIHDGELVPSLDNRKAMARLIRDWQADIVMGHRPYDYHPDHRYTGVLMDDTAVVVAAPFFVPDTPPTTRNPVYLYYSDSFQDPKPFTATVVVGIDAAAEKKWQCISAMPSQFGDKDSWQARTLPNVPQANGEREAYLLDLVKSRSAAVANEYRDRLMALYGSERGQQNQVCRGIPALQYGRSGDTRGTERSVPDAALAPAPDLKVGHVVWLTLSAATGASRWGRVTGLDRVGSHCGVPLPRLSTTTRSAAMCVQRSAPPSGQRTTIASTAAEEPRPTCTRASLADR